MSADFETSPTTSPFQRDQANPVHSGHYELNQEPETMAKNPNLGVNPDRSLDTASVEDLQRQKDELDRQITERLRAEKQAVIQQIVDVASQYKVTIEELIDAMGGFKPKRKGVKATAKYRDPVSGVTWSGRGKEPTWMRGHDRDDFLIKED